MRSENAIEVKGISKNFKVYFDKGSQLKERMLFRSRNRYENRAVLKDVSFNVKKGEAIGLIGTNGCGKSTTLKMLTKILYPDTGSIEMDGRVSALIELGAGFHPDMSGRENIYTNAAIFGLTKKEIDQRVDDIIEFSGLNEYIDNPVRTYSSGMYTRLAFSVAINVDADILLVDEILSVGDASFQAKCFRKIEEIKKSGVTIVLVSHDLGSVEKICDRVLWIKNGLVEKEGKPKEVIKAYMDAVLTDEEKEEMGVDTEDSKENQVGEVEKKIQTKEQIQNAVKLDRFAEIEWKVNELNNIFSNRLDKLECQVENLTQTKKNPIREERFGTREIEIKQIELLDKNRNLKDVFEVGEKILIKIKYVSHLSENKPIVGFAITNEDGIYYYGTNTSIDGVDLPIFQGDGEFICEIDSCTLLKGRYYLDIAISDKNGKDYDWWGKMVQFKVLSAKEEVGIARLPHNWNV